MQASDITALVAVQAQVAVLQEAHAMLSCHLELDSWAETWAAADVQQAFDATTSRVAHAMTVHVIGDLLPNFAYCEPTHRFARMVRSVLHCLDALMCWMPMLPCYFAVQWSSTVGTIVKQSSGASAVQHTCAVVQDTCRCCLHACFHSIPVKFAHLSRHFKGLFMICLHRA